MSMQWHTPEYAPLPHAQAAAVRCCSSPCGVAVQHGGLGVLLAGRQARMQAVCTIEEAGT